MRKREKRQPKERRSKVVAHQYTPGPPIPMDAVRAKAMRLILELIATGLDPAKPASALLVAPNVLNQYERIEPDEYQFARMLLHGGFEALWAAGWDFRESLHGTMRLAMGARLPSFEELERLHLLRPKGSDHIDEKEA